MNARLPSLLLLNTDSILADSLVRAFDGMFEITRVATVAEAIQALGTRRFEAVAWDRRDHQRDGAGFPELVRHIAPGIRVLSSRMHLAPHMVTAARIRPRATQLGLSAAPSAAVLDAMVASADDPVFDSPYVN